MTTFTLKKGAHWSRPFFFLRRFIPTKKKSLNFTVEFDSSCLYKFDNEDAWDINKLFGVGLGINHHNNSVRLGWRCFDGSTIEILTYCYVEGLRIPETTMCKIKPNEKISCQICMIDNQVIFTVTGINFNKTEIINRKKSQTWGFYLWPYFGGNQKAPHTMYLKLSLKDETV